MHSVLTYKATRVPRLVIASLSLPEAIKRAGELYDHSKLLSDHGYLASGVTVVVLSDEVAAIAIEKGSLPPRSENALLYQCGGY